MESGKFSDKLKVCKYLNFKTPMPFVCAIAAIMFVSCESKAEGHIDVPSYHDLSEARLSTQECLAVNSYFEGRGESDIANLAIMTTVYKRALLGGRYGNTMCEAVFKPNAYSWTSDQVSDKIHDKVQYKRLYALAEEFLLNKVQYLINFDGVDHYVKANHKTNWDYEKLTYIARIDQHLFYRHK